MLGLQVKNQVFSSLNEIGVKQCLSTKQWTLAPNDIETVPNIF